VDVTIDIADDVFLSLALTAHEKNITLNTMVEYILSDYILENSGKSWDAEDVSDTVQGNKETFPCHEMTATSHDVSLSESIASISELHDEIRHMAEEAGHDMSGTLGDLLSAIQLRFDDDDIPGRGQIGCLSRPLGVDKRESGETIPEEDFGFRSPTVKDALNRRSCHFRYDDMELWRAGRLIDIDLESDTPFEIRTLSGDTTYAAFCRVHKDEGE